MKVRSLRVEETFNFIGPQQVREHTGWTALVEGELLVEPSAVPSAICGTHQIGCVDPTAQLAHGP